MSQVLNEKLALFGYVDSFQSAPISSLLFEPARVFDFGNGTVW
jgi:hypothetical protein